MNEGEREQAGGDAKSADYRCPAHAVGDAPAAIRRSEIAPAMSVQVAISRNTAELSLDIAPIDISLRRPGRWAARPA